VSPGSGAPATRVLLIEDNPGDAVLIRKALRSIPGAFALEHVELLRDGLELLERDAFDVVLLDLSLPDAPGGLATFARVYAAVADLPIIVLTGFDDGVLAHRCMQAGAQDYLAKGDVFDTLLTRSIHYAVDRKRVEQALARREREFRAVVEHSPDSIARYDRELRHRFVNAATERVMARPAADFVDRTPEDLDFPPELTALLREHIPTAFATREVREFEFELPTADGTRVFHTRAVPEVGASGEMETVLAVSRDITALRSADLLRERENRILESISRGSPLAETLAELTGLVEAHAPETLCSALLLAAGGATLHTVAAPTLSPAFSGGIDGLPVAEGSGACGTAVARREMVVIADVATDPFVTLPLRGLLAEHGIAACWSYPILASEGAPLGTFAVYYRTRRGPSPVEVGMVERAAHLASIAIERAQNEAALHEAARANSRFAAAFDNVSLGVLITDPALPDNPVIYANPGFFRLTGYGADEVMGRNCRFLQGPDTDRAEVGEMRRAIAERRTYGGTLTNYRRDGTPFRNELTVSPVHDRGGRLINFVGIVNDATERLRVEQRLLQASRMEAVGRLAGGVAHDFNNLLTAIRGNTDLVLLDLPADAPWREDVLEVQRATDRAVALTSQLLAFSRQQVLERRVLDLNGVIQELHRMLARVIGEDIHLVTDLHPGLGSIQADRGQIEQVIVNLAVNARDAMPDGGVLTIATRNVADAHGLAPAADGFVLLEVRDNGHGMDARTRERAFEPFFTTKEQGKGTGLGLATVYGIVTQSGGQIALDAAPGGGTTVRIHLPRAAGVEAPSVAVGRAALPTGNETVLLVEDEPAVRRLSHRVLERVGYRVLQARDGRDALRVMDEHDGALHLLLTDMVMPNMGGRELARRVRAARPGTRILFMSGYTDEPVQGAREADDLESAFIQKPFSPEELTRRIRAALDG